MAAGDKIPGDNTTNMPSITSTTLLLQHDGKNPNMKMETPRKASFSDLPLNKATQQGVMEISFQLQKPVCSFFLVSCDNQVNYI